MELREPRPHRVHGYQTQRRADDRTRQQRFPGTKSDGTHLHEDFVKQAAVVELACELAATDNPNVLSIGRRHHFLVNWTDVSTNEANVHARNRWSPTRAEHPGRLRIRPRLR